MCCRDRLALDFETLGSERREGKMPDSPKERLLQAYRETSFFADTPHGHLELRIGDPCPRLEHLLVSLGARTWAYVTAFNPGSISLSHEENHQRHLRLEQRVQALGLPVFPGEGLGDDRTWPAERSLLIAGVSREAAIHLGREFGQLAVVYGEIGVPPELVE